MANKLTGSYDAVAQISRRQLNGLLASLQQNGASARFLHNCAAGSTRLSGRFGI